MLYSFHKIILKHDRDLVRIIKKSKGICCFIDLKVGGIRGRGCRNKIVGRISIAVSGIIEMKDVFQR